MRYKRMPIEVESPEELGYDSIRFNLAESSVRDRKISDLKPELENLVLFYGDHKGLPSLRNLILNGAESLNIDDVLVCQAAAMALFIVHTTILQKEDHLIVVRPNYGTNIETPRATGCEISIVDLKFENGYSIDIENIEKEIRPNTKLISITNPHNPTGTLVPLKTLNLLVALAEKHNCFLLVDETYRELNFQSELNPYLAEKSKNVISISSISKAYGLPGLRIGWIICKSKAIMVDFLAAKEQIIICNSVVDEYLANLALQKRSEFLSESHDKVKANFLILKNWMSNQNIFEWIEPEAGAVAFLKFKKEVDFDAFYKKLYNDYSTILGPGHWFEQSDQYFRVGFGYPTEQELEGGLSNILDCVENM